MEWALTQLAIKILFEVSVCFWAYLLSQFTVIMNLYAHGCEYVISTLESPHYQTQVEAGYGLLNVA